MPKIHERNRLYDFLLPHVCRTFRWSYRKVEYRNTSAIPSDGAVIFAPNHANTLMDAIAVLSIDDRPKVFVARADIFKNPKVAAILHFLKILPINRIRDGVEALAANEGIMEQCIDALCDGVPFCILPEGRHRPMHSLLPLKKGIARIAFGAYDRIKDHMPVYIVPVGLEYEDYFDFRSRLLVNIGEAIHLQDFVAGHPGQSEQELYRNLLVELSGRMKETIIYLPDDERYEGTWEAANILSGRRTAENDNLLERKQTLQRTAERLLRQNPRIIERAQRQARRRKALGIRLKSLVKKRHGWELLLRSLSLLLIFPFVLLETLLLLPALLVTAIVKKKIQDKTFVNSIRYVVGFLLNPVLIFLLSAFCLFFLPWWICLGAFLLSFVAPIAVYDWNNGLRNLLSDLKYRQHKNAFAA